MLRHLAPGLVLLALVILIAASVHVTGVQVVERSMLMLLRVPNDIARPIGPAWLAETGRDITSLGSNGVWAFLLVVACGGLFVARRGRHAAVILVAFMLAQILCNTIKVLVQRPRPELQNLPDVPRVFTTSFPSSHAMVTAATLFVLAAVAADLASPKVGRFAFAMAALGTVLVGLSRIYLGLHWPGDVLAGWTAGLFCAWAAWVSLMEGRDSETERSMLQTAGRRPMSRVSGRLIDAPTQSDNPQIHQ